MKKQLFQYVVLYHQFDENRKFVDTIIITQPTYELAKTENDLLWKITREIPTEYAGNPDDVEIIVRNF